MFLAITTLFLVLSPVSSTRYFRFLNYDGRHQYRPRMEVLGKDTSRANCYRCTYDKSGRLKSWTYLSAGRVIEAPGFKVASVQVAMEGGMEWHRYFDAKGRQARTSNTGEYAEAVKYDVDHRKATTFQYDSLGDLIDEDYNGASRYLWMCDDSGRMVKQYALDKEGKRITDYDGVYETQYAYDADGNYSRTEFLNKEGDHIAPKQGTSIYLYSYDKQRNFTEERHLGIDEQPVGTSARIRYTNDPRGYTTKIETFDKKDQPISRKEITMDEYGNLLSIISYGKNGALTSKEQSTFDNLNRKISTAYFDSLGLETVTSRNDYDAHGNLIRERLYKNGKLSSSMLGFAQIKYEYDAQDRQLSMEYLDETDAPTERGADAVAKQTWEWDQPHFLIRHFYDTQGRPTMSKKDNAATLKLQYTQGGMLQSFTRLDVNGRELKDED